MSREMVEDLGPSSVGCCTKAGLWAKKAELYSETHFMAKWHDHLNDDEKQILDHIYAARERLNARDREYTERIKRIMNRAIRRMRRAEGKS